MKRIKRCKNCLLFDKVHYWCNVGSDRNPNTPACEYFIDEKEADSQ